MTEEDKLRYDADKERIEAARDSWIEANMSELLAEHVKLGQTGDFEMYCNEKWEEYIKAWRENNDR